MKKGAIALIVASLFSLSVYAITIPNPVSKKVAAPPMDKVSYAMGASLGKRLKMLNIPLDQAKFTAGLSDAITGKTLKMTDEEMQQTLKDFQMYLIQQKSEEYQKAQVTNQKESDEFFQKNKTKPGVITLADGLQYKVIKEGSGSKASKNDSVTLDYVGSTLDGKEFDSSASAGKPITVQVGYLVPGMAEALQLMKAGSTWEIYIPPKLGYGDRGAPPKIGPNQGLIFKVTVVSVQKKK